MITAAELWTVSYTVAGIAALAAAAGMIVLRLLAARSVATSLTVVAAVTVAATLAAIVVISLEMFISRKDLDVVLAVVAIAGIAGFAVALLLGRRVSAASRLLLGAVQEVGRGGGYCPPRPCSRPSSRDCPRRCRPPTACWPKPATVSGRWRRAAGNSSRGSAMTCGRRWRACGPWLRLSRTAWSPTGRRSAGTTRRSAPRPTG